MSRTMYLHIINITYLFKYGTCFKGIMIFFLFVSNANPLHYYALRVPRKVDRWH